MKESRKRTTRKGQNKEEEVDENKEEEIEEENQEEEAAPRSTRRRAQAKEPVATPKRKATPKGKKVEKEEQENGEEEPTPKRSLRNRDAKPEPVTPKSAKVEKTPVKSGQRKKPEKEESEEDEIVKDNLKTPKEKVKKGKQSHSSTKKAVDTEDPYDMDSQLDLHPDPLKNVVVSLYIIVENNNLRYLRVCLARPSMEKLVVESILSQKRRQKSALAIFLISSQSK